MADNEKYKVRMQGTLEKSFDICFVSGAEHYYLCIGSLHDIGSSFPFSNI